ncbi:MAG TPA: PQQ-binding-like beta-propeller repeat protein [Pirellulales bacterium]|jgi:outer membrane protein assembly factor BamB|nr:PQQ-binding-like beta-propeller repeat protein [Pirellulales bacterium]
MMTAHHGPKYSLVIGCLIVALLGADLGAQEDGRWPRWRGEAGQGVADAELKLLILKLPERWPAAMTPAWTASLGTGWSSPVVADGRVFVTDRTDGTERVLAFEAKTGRELWTHSDPVDFDPHAVGARHGNGPKSTPSLANGKIYSLGIAGRLQCLDATSGKPVWEVNFPDRFGTHQKLGRGRAYVSGTDSVIVPVGKGEGAPVPLFGYTGSLLVAGKLVISSVGGAKGGTIMAFDAKTGQEVWRSLHDQVSYSSPVAARLAGIEQVVVMTGPAVVGLELATGRKLWSHPFQIQYNESISTPSVADPYVVVTGDGRPLTALKIGKREDGCSLDVAWQNRDLSSYLSSMIVHDGHVYGMNDGGEFGCLRLADGKTIWLDGHFGFYCTPVLVGSRLLCLNERGKLFVLTANPERSPSPTDTRETRLSERATWTSPALADGRLYLRADGQLLAFDLP